MAFSPYSPALGLEDAGHLLPSVVPETFIFDVGAFLLLYSFSESGLVRHLSISLLFEAMTWPTACGWCREAGVRCPAVLVLVTAVSHMPTMPGSCSSHGGMA